MNLSGKAVRYWMNELKIPVENLLVLSDDLNIPFGTLRLRKNGSAGGHNGLTNINELIGTQDYARIRIGIGNDYGRGQQINYVLGELSPEEKEQMPEICKRAIDGIKAWATIGADRAMNVINTKPKTKENPEKPA
jgi:PTH1 family peptidyl-tRNA hydrolase